MINKVDQDIHIGSKINNTLLYISLNKKQFQKEKNFIST